MEEMNQKEGENLLERLKKYIKSCGLTHLEFARSIGLKKTTFNNKIQGVRSIEADMLISIFTTYPNLSADWLLTGRGNMLRENVETMAAKDELIATLRNELQEKNEQLRLALSKS